MNPLLLPNHRHFCPDPTLPPALPVLSSSLCTLHVFLSHLPLLLLLYFSRRHFFLFFLMNDDIISKNCWQGKGLRASSGFDHPPLRHLSLSLVVLGRKLVAEARRVRCGSTLLLFFCPSLLKHRRRESLLSPPLPPSSASYLSPSSSVFFSLLHAFSPSDRLSLSAQFWFVWK